MSDWAGQKHDHKGYSEEKCVRCGWVMGHPPLNCMNDDTPHAFPSQQEAADEIERGMGERTVRVKCSYCDAPATWAEVTLRSCSRIDLTGNVTGRWQQWHAERYLCDRCADEHPDLGG